VWVSWLSLKTKVDSFSLVWTSKPMTMACQWFGLKITGTVFSGLTSKPLATVSGGLALKPAAMVSGGLASKSAATISGGLASKPAATVSPDLVSKSVVSFLVEPQNQGAVMVSRFGS
jgi:hypothetical protein